MAGSLLDAVVYILGGVKRVAARPRRNARVNVFAQTKQRPTADAQQKVPPLAKSGQAGGHAGQGLMLASGFWLAGRPAAWVV